MTIKAEIEPTGAFSIVKSTCIKVVGCSSYALCGHLYAKEGLDVTSLIKHINAFDPDEPAGEWRVMVHQPWNVRDKNGNYVCNSSSKKRAARIVRDHNRKYDPQDVEALMEFIKTTVIPHQHWCKTVKLPTSKCDCGWDIIIRSRDIFIAKLKGEYAYITGEDIAETMPPKQGEA